MKKFALFIIATLFIASSSWAVEKPFVVTKSSVTQNMVPNSTQNIVLTLTSRVSPSSPVTVHCSFSSSSGNLKASFNNNGCLSAGGVGVSSATPVTVNLTLSASAKATGTLKGKVIFKQTNGRTEEEVSIPITITSGKRTITFKNYCPQNIWFGISSSAVPAKNTNAIACSSNADCSKFTYSLCTNGFCGGGACQSDSGCVNSHAGTCAVTPGATSATCTYCSSNSDCMDGSRCNTTNHKCYWINPAPANADTSHYKLAARKGDTIATNKVIIPDYSSKNGYALQWGGGFAGRTNCTFANDKLTCKTAGCNTNGAGDKKGGCNLGEGLATPSTSAEVTFVAISPDTYDVTVINGENIPVIMRPTPGSAASPQDYRNPYLCGFPGSPSKTETSNGTIGGCSWDFKPPSLAFTWVDTDDNHNCTADSTCTAINPKFRCGLTINAVGTTPSSGSSQKKCGTPLGYWNQNEICAKNKTYNKADIVNCTLSNIGGSGNSMINLLACTGNAAVSCYNINTSSTTCCGCTNWQNQGVTVPTKSSIVEQCKFPNSNWGSGSAPGTTGNVLPGLIWLKKACPSAYVYPFDDKASTFTCPSNNGQSGVSYTVEFCKP